MRTKTTTGRAEWHHRTDAADAGGGAWVQRFDRSELRSPRRRKDGILVVDGIAVKECVLSYPQPDGRVIRELVPESTIRASASEIEHLPLCLHHPRDKRGNPIKVTPANTRELSHGNVDGAVTVGEGAATRVSIAIRSAEAQKAATNGTAELSLSYDCQIDPTPGVHPIHGPYEVVQKARSYDHIALVDRGRVGPDARIRLDGESTTLVGSSSPPARPRPVSRWDSAFQAARGEEPAVPRQDSAAGAPRKSRWERVFDEEHARTDAEDVARRTPRPEPAPSTSASGAPRKSRWATEFEKARKP